jgi:type IV pilus assembly protein PilA
MLKNKKGFTLVELLAVIVILAIILAIAVPSISGMISNAKKSAFEDSVKMIITGIEYKTLEATVDSTATVPAVGDILNTLDQYGANKADYEAASITDLTPVTVTIQSAANSKFGAWKAENATKSSVTVTEVAE